MDLKPTLQALVLADHIYVDRFTGKNVIAGTFNRLWAEKFPQQLSRATFAYICLTNIHAATRLMLCFVDLKTHNVIMKTRSIEVKVDNPLVSTELIIQIPPFPMPAPGFYAFELHAGDEMVGSLRIQMALKKDTDVSL